MTDTSRTVSLGLLTKWLSGGTPNRGNPDYWGGVVPWISAATLKASRISRSDQTLTELGVQAGSKMAPAGSILMLVRGMALHRETRIGVATRPLSFNQDVKALIPKKGISAEFLLYALQARSNQILDMVSSAGSGTGVLDTKVLQRLPIWVPTPEGQKLIVEALTAVDQSVEMRERLIAKKRAMKQGLMQQLLPGRTRLPGFVDEWKPREIGDFAEVRAGGTPSTSVPRYWGGPIRWMSSGEIHQKRVVEVKGRISPDGLRESAARVLPVGTVLMALAGQGKTRGTVAVSRVELTTNQSIAGILPSDEHDSDFLYYNLDQRYDELRGESAGGGGRGGLNLTIIKRLRVLMPSVAEQRAIAGVLSEVDDELAVLAAGLEKARQVRTGMMQQLLTGRVRLGAGDTE